MQKTNDYIDTLKHNGLKSTKHRTAILEILEQSDQPIAAEQIYLKLKGKDISINLSTVYRILEALVSRNLVIKSTIADDSRALFELNRMVHKHHLICMGCKKMFSVGGCPFGKYEKLLQDKMGFDITGHKLKIYGYCQNCKVTKK